MTRAEQRTPKCARCGQIKPRDKFGKRQTGALHSWCRSCHNEHARDRRAALLKQQVETSQFICGNS